MTNDKFKPIQNAPKNYEQFILDNQFEQDQIVADSYAAELDAYGNIGVQKGFGPCFEYSCRCTKQQLRGQIRQLENKIPCAPDGASFHLSVGFYQNRLWNWHFDGADWITMYSVEDACSVLRKFENKTYEVYGAGAMTTPNSRKKRDEIVNYINDCINRNNRNEKIDEKKDFN